MLRISAAVVVERLDQEVPGAEPGAPGGERGKGPLLARQQLLSLVAPTRFDAILCYGFHDDDFNGFPLVFRR